MMNIPEPVYIVLFLTFSGLIIRTCLVIVGQSWSKTYHYLGTYILLPNIAYVVTTVIANNIALQPLKTKCARKVLTSCFQHHIFDQY